MTGVGIDLIEIDRLEAALARRPRLATRLFSPDELEYATGRPGRHLAGRFAAKEAIVKALRLEVAPALREIEVLGCPPRVRLSGRAAEVAEAAGVELQVSITHSRELAAAIAAAVPVPNGQGG